MTTWEGFCSGLVSSSPHRRRTRTSSTVLIGVEHDSTSSTFLIGVEHDSTPSTVHIGVEHAGLKPRVSAQR
ncbi:hypothetical protein A2U01_0088669, partial [Trifolium medium]|nr:hypothetical protein [Trifolium medium]